MKTMMIAETWWQIYHKEGKYTIGPSHNTLENAQWYLKDCLHKKIQKKCCIMRFEVHKFVEP